MVRRNLMIAVLDKQRRLLEQLAEQLSERLDRQPRHFMADCLFCCEKTTEVADNLNRWIEIQKSYEDCPSLTSFED